MTIVTDRDDNRYRTAGRLECEPHAGTPQDADLLESLPRVPGWPIAPAPQYLSDDPKTPLREGDILAQADPDGYWIISTRRCGEHLRLAGGCGDTIDFLASRGWKVWLLARADPEEDAVGDGSLTAGGGVE